MTEQTKATADKETVSVLSNPTLQQQAKLDEGAKRLLSLAPVLAVLLQKSVPELQNYTTEFIINAIKIRENVMVSPDFTVESRAKITADANTESKVINEKTLFFDKIIDIKISDLESLAVNLIIDYEVQGETNPQKLGYPLEYRGVYYLSRLISSQLNYVEEDTKDYDRLNKVYSIWICLNGFADEEKNSIVSYSLQPQKIAGGDFKAPSADLMQLIVVKLGDSNAGNIDSELMRFLYGVFEYAKHKEYFEEFVDTDTIEHNATLKKELSEMSGVGAALYDSGVRAGESRGKLEGKIQVYYYEMSLTPEEIAEKIHLPLEDIKDIINKI